MVPTYGGRSGHGPSRPPTPQPPPAAAREGEGWGRQAPVVPKPISTGTGPVGISEEWPHFSNDAKDIRLADLLLNSYRQVSTQGSLGQHSLSHAIREPLKK